MSDDGFDVLFKNAGQLIGRVGSLGQPFWILSMPDQRVTANLHVVCDRERQQPIGLLEIKRLRLRMDNFPLERIFWLQHAELASQRGGIVWLGQLSGSRRGAHQKPGVLCNRAERWLLRRCARCQQRGPGQKQHPGSPRHRFSISVSPALALIDIA